MRVHQAVLFAVVGAVVVPLFGRLALSGTGHQGELIRYLVPLFVGTVAGSIIGVSRARRQRKDDELKALNHDLQAALEQSREAAVALAESEVRLQQLLATNPAGVVVIDVEDRRIVEVNEAAARMVGRTREEMLGHGCYRFICPKQEGTCPVSVTIGQVAQGERTLLDAGGQEIPILKSVTSITLGGREHLLEAFLDLRGLKAAEAERHALQERVASLERVEALGVLAGGVAHDLNNVLGPLVALPEVIQEGLDKLALGDSTDLDDMREDLATIKDSAERASRTVADLSTLSQRARMEQEVVDLSAVVGTWAAGEAERALRGTALHLDLADAPLPVLASSPHLLRVLHNLTDNAVAAMGGEGRVEVRTRSHGGEAVLEVRDRGRGMSSEEVRRIFEPFYSRKRQGEGTGLGLTIVQRVVQDHQGRIEVESTPGSGTVFTVSLPLTAGLPEQPAPREPAEGGGERILVVDDESYQRRVARRVLERLGYGVDVAASGHEALAIFAEQERSGAPYDLVLLDVIMEGMDGGEVLRCIRRLCPDQAVLMVSGFAPADAGTAVEEFGVGWLQKPYGIDEVASAVRKAISG